MLAPIPIPVEFASSSLGASIKLLCIQSTASLLSPASAELVWKNPCVTPVAPMLTEPGISTVGVTVPASSLSLVASTFSLNLFKLLFLNLTTD